MRVEGVVIEARADPAKASTRAPAPGPRAPATTPRRAWVRRVLFEPMTHFVILGAMLFGFGQLYAARTSTYRIEVTPAHVAQIARKYALQFGHAPEPATLESLVADDIHDEILFRQGLALRLGEDDEIVRRRVIQKEQFLLQDLKAPAEPTDAELRAFYAAHPALYAAAARTTFSHVYFAVGAGGDAVAEARARAVLATLTASVGRAPERGDAFPDLYDFAAYEPEQVARLFGHTPLAAAVATAPVGQWSGPFKSAYGWHLIHVDARTPAEQPPLAEVRDRVRGDYLQARQDQANAAAFDTIARRFTVVRNDKAAR